MKRGVILFQGMILGGFLICVLGYSAETSFEKKLKCTITTTPPPLVRDKQEEFESYRSRTESTYMIEYGKTRDGVLFSMTRGGCIEFGEVYVLQFASQTQAIQNVAFWIKKVAQALKEIESGSNTSILSKRSKQLKELLDKKPDYQYATSVKVGDDIYEVVATDLPDRQIKIQVNINASL